MAGGLGLQDVEAALITYLAAFAARLHRRGLAARHITGLVRELTGLPATLEAGAVRGLVD
jgi:predicted component of type VI protein secretion system